MSLVLLSASHHDIDLADVERLSVDAASLGSAVVAHDAVRGAMVLATCNRLELYLDTAPARAKDALAAARATLVATSGVPRGEVDRLTRALVDDEALHHLFDVASGLDSMVVGEREITGQVRRALEAARRAGTSTALLEIAVQRASRTSRRVSVETDLARSGRSVVSVALDLAGHLLQRPGCPRETATWGEHGAIALPPTDWTGARAVLVGTGAYAGASLAALRARGCADVAVWSGSGRAQEFAVVHGCDAVSDGSDGPGATTDALERAIAAADLVVTCRGTGATTLDVDLVARALARRTGHSGTGHSRTAHSRTGADGSAATPLAVLDLALRQDVEADVRALPGVVLVDLETVRQHAPAAVLGEVRRAQRIVAEAVAELSAETAARRMDKVVVAIRDRVAEALEDELSRLPMSGEVTAEQAAYALRRLAARLVHRPTVHAREAGRRGREQEFVDALDLVFGFDVAHLVPDEAAAAAPATPGAAAVAEAPACPFAGLGRTEPRGRVVPDAPPARRDPAPAASSPASSPSRAASTPAPRTPAN